MSATGFVAISVLFWGAGIAGFFLARWYDRRHPYKPKGEE